MGAKKYCMTQKCKELRDLDEKTRAEKPAASIWHIKQHNYTSPGMLMLLIAGVSYIAGYFSANHRRNLLN